MNEFTHDNYKNVIIYDFRHNKSLRNIFDADIDVDSIIRKSTSYFSGFDFIPYESIIVYEEIGDCPLARTTFKSFAMDKRYSIITTGSLLGVMNIRKRTKIDIPTVYEKIIQMASIDFEEFLWMNGLSEDAVKDLKKYASSYQELPSSLADYYKEMLKRYVIAGGMHESVKEFLRSNNYINSRKYLIGLKQDYRADFGRFIDDENRESIDYHLQMSLNRVFDSIPSQLARESDTLKFKYSEIKKGGRASEFEEPLEWLEKLV